jgi:hypothetical protein
VPVNMGALAKILLPDLPGTIPRICDLMNRAGPPPAHPKDGLSCSPPRWGRFYGRSISGLAGNLSRGRIKCGGGANDGRALGY